MQKGREDSISITRLLLVVSLGPKKTVVLKNTFQSSFHVKSAAAFREAAFLIDCFLTCCSFISSWPFCLAIESSSSDPLILVISCEPARPRSNESHSTVFGVMVKLRSCYQSVTLIPYTKHL